MSEHVSGLERHLHKVDARRAHRGLPAVQALIVSPHLELRHGALEQRFHCASVDKVFVACVIARLIESGTLSPAQTVGQLLPEVSLRLPALPGVNGAREITVERLLSHTSGLPDYIDPPRGQRSAASFKELVRHPNHVWTHEELLDAVADMSALARPGERFSYTDTAYFLLQLIIEEVTGDAYRDVLQRMVLEPADMSNTVAPFDVSWTRDTISALAPAPMWFGKHEMSRCASLTAGSYGLLTTADDLVRFQTALHTGTLVSESSLAWMASPRHRYRPGIRYGAGMVTFKHAELMPIVLRGLPDGVGGLGITGCHVAYYPRQRAHVVLNFHSTKDMAASFRTHVRIAQALARH